MMLVWKQSLDSIDLLKNATKLEISVHVRDPFLTESTRFLYSLCSGSDT